MRQPLFKKISITPLKEIEKNLLEQIGGWKIIGWGNTQTIKSDLPITQPHVISPLHGRSAWIMNPKWGAVSIKGIGWTIGNIPELPSPKDSRMIFGLYERESAAREWNVSQYLEQNKIRSTHVLGYAEDINPLKDSLRFIDGSTAHSTLLYTKSISPWRVADLVWMNEIEKKIAFSIIMKACLWNEKDFISCFMSELCNSIAMYHSLGCINDSLSSDNVTLAAEITDFEWFGTPLHPLPDGTLLENDTKRRCKEIIYAYEIGCFLCHALNREEEIKNLLPLINSSYKAGDKKVKAYLASLLNND